MSAKIIITLALVALGAAVPHNYGRTLDTNPADTTNLEAIVEGFLSQNQIDPAGNPTEMMKQLTLSILPLVRQVMERPGLNSYSAQRHLDAADQLVPSIMDSSDQLFNFFQSTTPALRSSGFQRFNPNAVDSMERMKQFTLSMMPVVRQMTEIQGRTSDNTRRQLDAAEQALPTIMDSIAQMFRSMQARTLAQRTSSIDNKDLAKIVVANLPELDHTAPPSENVKQLTLSMLPAVRQIVELTGHNSHNNMEHLDTADRLVPTIMDSVVPMLPSNQPTYF